MDSVEYVKTNPLVGLDISSLPAPTKAPVIGNFRGVKQAQLEANQESDRVGGAQIEYQTATASVSRATQMLNSAKAEQTALQGQLQSAQAQLQSAQQERANAQTQAQAIQGQIAQAQADFTRRQEEARAQTEANAIADARERELVKSQIAKAQAEREVMRRQEEARAQAEMQEALKQKTAREQELARIQAEREAVAARIEQEKIEAATSRTAINEAQYGTGVLSEITGAQTTPTQQAATPSPAQVAPPIAQVTEAQVNTLSQPSVNQKEWYRTSMKALDDKYAWVERLLNESTYASPEKSEGGLVTSKPILGREADYERARQGINAKERELNILNNTSITMREQPKDYSLQEINTILEDIQRDYDRRAAMRAAPAPWQVK